MNPPEAAFAYVGAFVDELARAGIRDVCLCPGSRSTPLALLCARHRELRVWTHVDERCASFFALGMAKAHRRPVAVLGTSGTAAAEFFPAVVEARYGRVPLVVLTADRPHELRDCGAPQTIDQIKLYGTQVKWFCELAPPDAAVDLLRYARITAGRAVAVASQSPPGPVHLNFPFREPLVPRPVPPPGGADEVAAAWQGRPGGEAYVTAAPALRAPAPAGIARLAQAVAGARRGLIVCGPQDDPALPAEVTALARRTGFPVLADPLSQVRCGEHPLDPVLDAYDAFLREPGLASGLVPDLVLRFGAVPTSKPLFRYLQGCAQARQVVVAGADAWEDPTLVASELVPADPAAFCRALGETLRGHGPAGADPAWREAWEAADRVSRRVIAAALAAREELFEGRVFAELAGLLPAGSLLYAGNSMPVRDLDGFFPKQGRPLRFLGNRGANGIDGVVSSALGAAAAGCGPVVLAVGDLSFCHDLGGLLAARRHGLAVTVVLLHNDGGGIFSFLPQAEEAEHFEELFGTPLGMDFRGAVETFGGRFSRAGDWASFRAAVRDGLAGRGLAVVEVPSERQANARRHRQIWEAVCAAVRREVPLP